MHCPKVLQEQTEFATLYAHAGFLHAGRHRADAGTIAAADCWKIPPDLEAHYLLSALALVNDDYEPALMELLGDRAPVIAPS